MDFNALEYLKSENMQVKDVINWNEAYQNYYITLALQELKEKIENELTESIYEHTLGKQKYLQQIQESMKLIVEAEQYKKYKYDKLFQNRSAGLNKFGNKDGNKKKPGQKGDVIHESYSLAINTATKTENIDSYLSIDDQNHSTTNSLDNLIEMINLKYKVDFCIQKLDPIVNDDDNYNNNNN